MYLRRINGVRVHVDDDELADAVQDTFDELVPLGMRKCEQTRSRSRCTSHAGGDGGDALGPKARSRLVTEDPASSCVDGSARK